MFSTNRLILRAYTPADKLAFQSVIYDAKVMFNQHDMFVTPRGPEAAEKWINGAVNDSTFFAVVERKQDGKFIGFTKINMRNARNRNGDFSIALLSQYWSQGYGTEVISFVIDHSFMQLGFHRISLTVYANNERARATYERLGFKEEGREREGRFVNGGWEDSIQMGILDREWMERVKSQ